MRNLNVIFSIAVPFIFFVLSFGIPSSGDAQETLSLQKNLDEKDLFLPLEKRGGEGMAQALLKGLEKRKKGLEEREERIRQEEERLHLIKKDLEGMLAESIRVREDLQKLKAEAQSEDEAWQHLIKVYRTMAPEEAALRIEKMNEKVVLDLLSRMKGKDVGQILGFVAPSKAARISEKLSKRRKTAQK
jgi:flagellar motility protein MotE (MotC chaperone)